MKKYNFKTGSYDNYSVPSNWKVRCYCDDCSEEINCCSCGKLLKYGESYTSRQIQTRGGFGYAVCSECYDIEFKEERD